MSDAGEEELIAALLAVRDDPATAAFDRAVAAAEAAGTIDSATARELTFWHRRSLEGLIDHATVVVPSALAARRRSDVAARESMAQARVSWEQAQSIQRQRARASDEASDESAAQQESAMSTPDGAPTRRAGVAGLSVVPTTPITREPVDPEPADGGAP